MLESVPAFLAVNLDVAACRRLAALQRDLRAIPGQPAGVSWTSPTNLRVVLRFLGAFDPSMSPALLDPLREWVAAASPIRVALGPLDAFPSAQRARLVVVQLTDAVSLGELADRVQRMLGELGVAAPKQPFHPHVTLARLLEPADVQAWIGAAPSFSCEARTTELAAYVHAQRRVGAEHVAIDRFGFAPPPRPSQRPSKAPRQPSQRPSKRPKPDAAAARMDKIPSPPRVPSIPGAPGVEGDRAPVQQPAAPPGLPAVAAAPEAGLQAPARSSNLPAAVEAALPPDEDWGT